MNIARSIGGVLLGLGAILLVIGLTASRSVANKLSATFLGRLTQNTEWYIFGGIALAVVGLILLFSSFRRRA